MKLTIKKALLTLACTLALPLSLNATETDVAKDIELSTSEKLTIERIF